MNQKIAFATYETPFAPGGGISAVMARLPHALQKATNQDVYIITPFHHNIHKTAHAEPWMNILANVFVQFDGTEIPVDVLMLQQDVNWIFLKPEMQLHNQPPFFAGSNHPYDLHQISPKGNPILLRDSLFFGKALAVALPIMDPDSAWILLLQDWETAPTCFALSNLSANKKPITPFLTLHNCYDHEITSQDFYKINVDPENFSGSTVLQCALPLVDDPLITVSEQFARDFSSELLISKIMMPHLSTEITNRLVGVNNGIFKELAIPKKVLTSLDSKDYTQLISWKSANRGNAYLALNDLRDTPETPVWGDINKFLKDDAPWLVLAGRDDPRQKGFEVACIAIDKFLSNGGDAHFLFFPIPGEEGLPGIAFIHELANKFPGSVICLPFLFREGYFAVMQGSSFGIMPSYYEPFGMANEFYLSGVVCIGRATGGILQQVVPYREVDSFSEAVKSRSDKLHPVGSPPTGLLYRERDDIPNAQDDWLEFDKSGYQVGGEFDRLMQRAELGLFRSMADELAACISDAVNIYRNNPKLYYEMLTNGISFITENFNWSVTAQKYQEIIRQVG